MKLAITASVIIIHLANLSIAPTLIAEDRQTNEITVDKVLSMLEHCLEKNDDPSRTECIHRVCSKLSKKNDEFLDYICMAIQQSTKIEKDRYRPHVLCAPSGCP